MPKERKIKFKEVSNLPNYQFNKTGIYKNLLERFKNSNIGIAELFGIPLKKSGNPLIAGISWVIRKEGLSSKFFVTARKKRVYIVNIEKSKIRRFMGSRNLKALGANSD